MGDGRRAWTLVDASWRELRKSQFLRVEHAAMAALSVRASAALAVAALDQGSPAHAREAAACAQKLARKHSRPSKAAALLIHAGVASIRGERQPAVDLLQRAEAEFRICEMAHFVAACQYRRGGLIDGDEGRALIAAAQAWATAQRVVKPACVFDMLAPGRWTFDA
jgi:eukaryotic-like serine/threonine-protein kinase